MSIWIANKEVALDVVCFEKSTYECGKIKTYCITFHTQKASGSYYQAKYKSKRARDLDFDDLVRALLNKDTAYLLSCEELNP
jgi:hypothetical protein